ncbi:MAG: DUF3253 domain-containing protein [Myxococcales bacterium]|nr:DUF3253 domain-containing protein [Myxococcales bacterium]
MPPHDPAPGGRALERRILEMLADRSPDASLCPSEVARAAAPSDWRAWMEPVRGAARRLVEAGAVEVTQRGRVVDPTRAKGPIRIRLPR